MSEKGALNGHKGQECEWGRTLGGTIRCASCGETMSQKEMLHRLNTTERLRVALLVVLDATDYTAHGCGVTEMVGAVLPKELIVMARDAIAYADTLESTCR